MTTEERIESLFEEARRGEAQPPRPRFSNAAGCIRAHVKDEIALRAGTWTPEEYTPVRWRAAAACGTAIGEMLETAAKRLGADTQVKAVLCADGNPPEYITRAGPDNLELFDYRSKPAVTGSADIVWQEAVWDIKCVGDYAWRQAQLKPKPEHVVQVASYAHALGKPTWVLLYLYLGSIGKGKTLRYLYHEGDADPRIAAAVVKHWLEVQERADKREIPAAPYKEPGFECSVCRHQQECWPTKGE